MQRAIQASLQQNSAASREDELLQKAIAESLSSTKGTDALTGEAANPHERKRKPGVPLGLKNIGNTCYVNSLVQVRCRLNWLDWLDWLVGLMECDHGETGRAVAVAPPPPHPPPLFPSHSHAFCRSFT